MCMSRRHCCDCKHTDWDRDVDGRTEGLGIRRMYDVLVSSVVYLPKKHNSIRNGRKGQLRVLLNSFHSMRLNTIRLICSPPHTHTHTHRETDARTHAHIRRLTARQAETQATDVSGGVTVWSSGVGSCSPTHTHTDTDMATCCQPFAKLPNVQAAFGLHILCFSLPVSHVV